MITAVLHSSKTNKQTKLKCKSRLKNEAEYHTHTKNMNTEMQLMIGEAFMLNDRLLWDLISEQCHLSNIQHPDRQEENRSLQMPFVDKLSRS